MTPVGALNPAGVRATYPGRKAAETCELNLVESRVVADGSDQCFPHWRHRLHRTSTDPGAHCSRAQCRCPCARWFGAATTRRSHTNRRQRTGARIIHIGSRKGITRGASRWDAAPVAKEVSGVRGDRLRGCARMHRGSENRGSSTLRLRECRPSGTGDARVRRRPNASGSVAARERNAAHGASAVVCAGTRASMGVRAPAYVLGARSVAGDARRCAATRDGYARADDRRVDVGSRHVRARVESDRSPGNPSSRPALRSGTPRRRSAACKKDNGPEVEPRTVIFFAAD
jgi:hypothetical protein